MSPLSVALVALTLGLSEPDHVTNIWDVLSSLMNNLPATVAAIGVIISLVLQSRTKTEAKATALEVKADLHAAKTELKLESDLRAERVAPKLERIETLVNGNLDREKQKNALLEAQIRSLGGTPVTEPAPPR